MPLKQGSSRQTVSHNIAQEMNSGRPQKQSIAIALNAARQARRRKMAMGGKVDMHDEDHEVKVPDDIESPEHADTAGEPMESGRYEEEHPMEYMAGGGIISGLEDMAKKKLSDSMDPTNALKPQNPMDDMPQFAHGGITGGIIPRNPMQNIAKHREPKHNEMMPKMAEGGEVREAKHREPKAYQEGMPMNSGPSYARNIDEHHDEIMQGTHGGGPFEDNDHGFRDEFNDEELPGMADGGEVDHEELMNRVAKKRMMFKPARPHSLGSALKKKMY